jgi:hypothetical protein
MKRLMIKLKNLQSALIAIRLIGADA